jgi:hypothetical protein
MLRGRDRCAGALAVLAWAAGVLTVASSAFAQPPPPPAQQALALVGKGIVWYDEGPVLLRGFASESVSLGGIKAEASRWRPQLDSSAGAVAGLLGEGGFIGGLPPARLASIAQPKPVSGGGCEDWQPSVEVRADFVVAADDLVSAASARCPRAADGARQPLFARSLRGGGWRVLRWLAGDAAPILAAEGDLLAVGQQITRATMSVLILDVRSGRVRAHFHLRDGYLDFASRNRLVLAVPREPGFPLGPREQEGGGFYGDSEGSSGPYELALYSTRGRRISGLGSYLELPLVSAMHLVENESSEAGEVISVRSLAGGAPTRLIGFDNPERELVTLAFRWPVLAMAETTRAILQLGEVQCGTGYYGQPSPAFLQIFDLARSEPFIAPPAPSPLESSDPLTGCAPIPKAAVPALR